MVAVADYLYLIIAIAVVAVAVLVGFVATTARPRGRRPEVREGQTGPTVVEAPPEPGVGEEAETPRDTPTRTIEDAALPEAPPAPPTEVVPPIERPETAASRLVRLRERLARSQGPL